MAKRIVLNHLFYKTCLFSVLSLFLLGLSANAQTNAADEAVWHPLFNGTDLSGWTVQCKPKDQGKTFWQVDAGTILCDSLGRPDHDYCWLVSDKEYGDFELRLKFQAYTNSPGNSGIQFRSRYDKDDQGGWLNGPQVDIHPPASQSWRTGLIYDETRGEQRWVSPSLPNSRIGPEHKLAGHVFKTANEGDGWNDLLIIAHGNHIKTVANGVVCTEWDGAGTLDNAAHRTKNVGSRGHFALQLHVKDQLRIRFKDIAIRELDGSVAGGVSVARGHPPADATEDGLVIVAADVHAPSANGTSVSNAWVTVTPAEFHGAINNPLKGFRDYKKDGYGLLKRQYIKWNDIEVGAEDTVERIIAHTTKITQIKGKRFEELNIKLVPRVYLDWDGSPGKQYWPADLQAFDYDSPAFQERLRRLIAKLGQAWDEDPRIFAVQMGLIGHFGEHHHPAPTAEQRCLLVEAFQKGFKNKPVLVRHHDAEFMQAGFGIYYDTFANFSREPPAGPKDQFPWQATYMYGDHWKRALVEGEVEYNWQQRRESAKPEATFGRTPDETMTVPAYRRYMIDKIRRYHASYLGWISDYDSSNREVLAGAAELQKVFGYRFVLDATSYPCTVKPGNKLTVKLTVRNTGSAPFNLDWPVGVGLLDPMTKKLVWSAPLSGVDLRAWLPGEEWDSADFAYRRPALSYQDEGQAMLPQDIKPGSYILALAILDRQGGLLPSARFAMVNYFRGGWHPLGHIGIGTVPKEFGLGKMTFDSPAFDDSLYYKMPE